MSSEAIHAVVEDPEAPGCYVSGWGVIIPGADVAPEDVASAMASHHGEDPKARTIVEVQHVWRQARVMWCDRYGQACEMVGEWHTHWHGLLHNPVAPTCCHTVAVRTRL